MWRKPFFQRNISSCTCCHSWLSMLFNPLHDMKLRFATLFSFACLETSIYYPFVVKNKLKMKYRYSSYIFFFEAKLSAVMICMRFDTVYELNVSLVLCCRICEICSSTASNVVVLGDPEFSDQWSETNNVAAVQAPPAETRRFWQGHRFLNFLLACMVFAFVISWLFHFNVPG